ncbi:MAG: ATP-binding cassette domain-containing protein [Anaerolineales bacterium]|nr:ATP-binding cassette domain-containing protein [Anaerolineales bacterium]
MAEQVLLQIKNLTKSYGDIRAVKDLSLDVFSGEVFGLLGPNGAGKTTTIKLMSGLLKPDSGEVILRGKPLAAEDGKTRRRIGICPQENVLWTKLTPAEQLIFLGSMYGMKPSLIRQRCQMLLEVLGLRDSANKLAGTLSGGMQRRLNIALALIHDPEIGILDEPEAGLDPQSRISVRKYIKSLADEKTIILTTHNMDEAERLADRVAIIDRGKLMVLDKPDTLKQTVGEGDVLEITLLNQKEAIELDLSFLEDRAQILIVDNVLQIRALDLVNLLQSILARLHDSGIQTGDIRLRKNTLEDVFIKLTGRRLRE